MVCNPQCIILPQVKEWMKGTVQVSNGTTIDGGLEAEWLVNANQHGWMVRSGQKTMEKQTLDVATLV
ncbi:hypothetical protein E2542_SST29151 [Spatholobus suberectus]|nr:hypothetical protein E2542_SST29151 [Spatholobus suberectus]